MFPKFRLKPNLTGLDLAIRAYLPWISGPKPLVKKINLMLPAGKRWWQRDQINGGWTYVDLENINGPVRLLTLKKARAKGKDSPEVEAEISLVGDEVRPLQQGRAWKLSFIQPQTKIRLNAFATAAEYEFNYQRDRKLPGDDMEDEPHD